MRVGPKLGALTLATMLAATLVACGSDDGSSGGGGDNGVAAKSPQEILAAARDALREAKSFRVAGSGTEDGSTIDVDMRIDVEAKNAQGTIEIEGTTIELVRIGETIYTKAPAEFYDEQGAPGPVGQLVGGRWLKAPITNENAANFAAFTDVDELLEPDGTVTKGEQTEVDGKPVVALVDSAGTDDEGTLFVATEGAPLPVAIEPRAGESGRIVFSDFGSEVKPTAPADAVDISQLG